jgi:type II secretory pathway component PulF
MDLYAYQALDAQGRKVRGTLEAPSRGTAYAQLRRRGLTPTELRLGAAGGGAGRARLDRRRLVDFLAELGELVAAGVPFRQSLVVMAQGGRDAIARVAGRVEAEVSAGHGLGDALARTLGREGSTLSALVAAGEASGDLGGSLLRGAEAQKQDLEVAEALLAAVSYPLMVLLMTLATLVVILTVVAPALRPLAERQGADLPFGLSLLFATSGFLIDHGVALCLALAVLLVTGLLAWRAGLLRAAVEAWLLDGPLAGISRPILFGGVGDIAGSLLAAKVNVSEALALAAQASPFMLVRRRLRRAIEQIREGAPVSQVFASCRGMPLQLHRLAAIGEETGRLGPMLQRGGRLERQRALRRLRALSQWLGPLLIVGLGVVIGLLFTSLLTGITALGAMEGG